MKKLVFRSINFFVFLAIAILLLYLSFKDLNMSMLWEHLKSANYWWILISLIIAVLSHLSRAYRWNILIEGIGYKANIKSTFPSLLVGYLANLAFPRIGELTRCGLVNKKEKIPIDKLLGTVIVERAFDMLILFGLLFILIFAKFDFFGGFIQNNIIDPMFSKLLKLFSFSWTLWIIIIAFIISCISMYFVFRERIYSITFIRKINITLYGILKGMKSVFKMKRVWEFILHTVIIWGLYWLMTYVAIFSLSATSGLKPIDGVFLLIIGGLGMSAPVQGGIGAYHGLVTLGLTLYSIPREDGMAFAILTHGSMSLMFIVVGCISLLALFISKDKTTSYEQA